MAGWSTCWEDFMSDPSVNWTKVYQWPYGTTTFATGSITNVLNPQKRSGWTSGCRYPHGATRALTPCSSGGFREYTCRIASGWSVDYKNSSWRGHVLMGFGAVTGYRHFVIGIRGTASGPRLWARWFPTYESHVVYGPYVTEDQAIWLRSYHNYYGDGIKIPVDDMPTVDELENCHYYSLDEGETWIELNPPKGWGIAEPWAPVWLGSFNRSGDPPACNEPTPSVYTGATGIYTYARVRKWLPTNPDVDPPIITSLTPTGVDVSPTTNIGFDTRDSDGNVVQGSIDAWLDNGVTSVPMVLSGVEQSGFSVVITGNSYNGYTVDIDPNSPLTPSTTYEVTAECDDDSANPASKVWEFTTASGAPYVINEDPYNGEEDIEKDTEVKFSIISYSYQVDITTVTVMINGEVIYRGSSDWFAWGWKKSSYISNALLGFDFTFVPDRSRYFKHGEDVSVKVYAEDTEGGWVEETWTFTIDDLPFLSIYPFIIGSIRNRDEQS